MGSLHALTLFDALRRTKKDTTNIVFFQVHDDSHGAILKFKQLVGFSVSKAIDTCHAVTDGQYVADLIKLFLGVDALQFLNKDFRHLTWFNFI